MAHKVIDLDANPYALNDVMEMDHVIRVWPDGTITEPRDVYAPDIDGGIVSGCWELLDGYSGQHGYSGPHMHSSEFIGGAMALDILARPGWYVAVCEHDHWAVAYVLAECEEHPGLTDVTQYCDGTCVNPMRRY